VDTIVVGGRYNGPSESGNGGYSCGLIAAATGNDEVTLRLPPPLDVPLRVEDGGVYDGDRLVATTAISDADAPVLPAFPGYDAARAAEERYEGLRDHPFPTCFACGPRRTDGLGLRPAQVGDVYATTWTPRDDVADGGRVRDEFVWAALDCPGGWALMQTGEAPILLGRLAVSITGDVRAGRPHVVLAWRRAERDGRKNFAATAVCDAAGTPLATGVATWIAVQSGRS